MKGGILVYIKTAVFKEVCLPKSIKLRNLCSEFKECILLELKTEEESVLFGTIYRKGKCSVKNNILLNDIINETSDKFDKILLCGDFNFPTIKWKINTVEDTPYSSAMKFYNCLQNKYLKQHVSEPTRVRGKDEPSLLDLIITEDSQTQVSSSIDIGSPLGLSDHAVLTWKYLLSIEEKTPNTVSEKPRKYNFYKGDYARFRTLCSNTDWGELLNDSMNIDEMVDTFDDIIQKYKDETIPLMAHKDGKKKQPWLNRASFKKHQEETSCLEAFSKNKDAYVIFKVCQREGQSSKNIKKS